MHRSSLLIETGEALRRVLRSGLASNGDAPPRIVDDLPAAGLRSRLLPFLSVHLYRVEEDRSLFDSSRVPVGPVAPDRDRNGGDTAVFRSPPVFLTLHYVIIPWGRDTVEQGHLLEQAIRAVMQASRSPDRPARIRFTHPFDLADQTHVLRSLGLPLRPVISCALTTCLESARTTTVPRVKARRVRVDEVAPPANRPHGPQGGNDGS